MTKIFIGIVLALTLAMCTPPAPLDVNVVPKPSEIVKANGRLKWRNEISISVKSEEEKAVAGFLIDFLSVRGVKASISSSESKSDVIFRTDLKEIKSPEAYQLSIDDSGVLLNASSGAGLFYGVQTLFQLIQGDHGLLELPYVKIIDAPRFTYRGLHLDVGRHFFSVEFVKRYIDLMAHFKINIFHWHLTEDQGWRIQIKKYPRLQEIGAYRKETVIGRATTRTRNEPHKYDATRHGGFYTQEEIKEVVRYAAQRYITVIPEIELPGHALAALASYPQLGCTGGPYEVATTWGIFNEVFCAGKDSTFLFLQNVLDEIIPLFPSKYIHIGGDECFKDSWKKCHHCQKRIRTENLKDEHELQSCFIGRIEKYLNSKGKSIIGWDEILEGGLAPNATVMSWRGEEGGIAAAKQNHDVIMTPSKWLYLDYMQDSSATEPLAVRVLVNTKTIYEYDPIPATFSADQAKHVLGLQANVWTEYMKTGDHVEYMVYPRAIAMAEVGWSAKQDRNYEDFITRLRTQRPLLDSWKINYAKHVFAEQRIKQ